MKRCHIDPIVFTPQTTGRPAPQGAALPRLGSAGRQRRWSATLAALGAILLGAPSCKEEAQPAAEAVQPSPAMAVPAAKPVKKKPSVRTKLEPWRPLIEEAARAELDATGLLIDLGTADQHKYTRGGWRTGWAENKQVEGISVAEVVDRRAHLDVLTRTEAREIALRVRSSVAGQGATLWVDGERQGDIWPKSEWSVLRVPVAAGVLSPGRHTVQLTFTKKGSPRAQLDWMWLPAQAGAEPPAGGLRVLPLRIGGQPKRALIAPSTRSYSFYLQPPANASLVFDYGSNVGVEFAVRAETNDGKISELFAAEGSDAWTERQVDLNPFAGQAIRLELAMSGSEGLSGWGEPVIMVPLKDTPKPPAKTALPGRPKNVIVILIDTVRAKVFSAFRADNQVKTPAYDAFADRSTVFVNAYNNENWTKPSVATTLSGIYPSTHDTKQDESKLPKEVTLISQRLQQAGFATAGFVANGYVSNKFGFRKGWDKFRNYIREERDSAAEHVYGDALAWLNERQQAKDDKPFFLYIQTIDPHVTYKVERSYTKDYFPEEYKGKLGKSIDAKELAGLSTGKIAGTAKDVDWVRALYYGEVTYHDEHMGKFLDQIEAMGRLDDTLLLITNDHGEELQDHGKFGHGHSLYEELLRAPLLMHFPGMFPAGKRIDEIVENVDVTPTILDILGMEPMAAAEGMSLLPLVEGKPVSRPYYAVIEFLDGRRAVRVGNWKFMRSSSTWVHLFDVAADPDEQQDRIDDSPIARRMCEVHLGEALATPDKSKRQQDITTRRKFKAGAAKIDPQMRRQLEALGYFGE